MGGFSLSPGVCHSLRKAEGRVQVHIWGLEDAGGPPAPNTPPGSHPRKTQHVHTKAWLPKLRQLHPRKAECWKPPTRPHTGHTWPHTVPPAPPPPGGGISGKPGGKRPHPEASTGLHLCGMQEGRRGDGAGRSRRPEEPGDPPGRGPCSRCTIRGLRLAGSTGKQRAERSSPSSRIGTACSGSPGTGGHAFFSRTQNVNSRLIRLTCTADGRKARSKELTVTYLKVTRDFQTIQQVRNRSLSGSHCPRGPASKGLEARPGVPPPPSYSSLHAQLPDAA